MWSLILRIPHQNYVRMHVEHSTPVNYNVLTKIRKFEVSGLAELLWCS